MTASFICRSVTGRDAVQFQHEDTKDTKKTLNMNWGWAFVFFVNFVPFVLNSGA
jgi:hypothetical protein